MLSLTCWAIWSGRQLRIRPHFPLPQFIFNSGRSEAYVLENGGSITPEKGGGLLCHFQLPFHRKRLRLHSRGGDSAGNSEKALRFGKDFGFARCFTEPVFTHFAKARNRRCISMDISQNENGAISGRNDDEDIEEATRTTKRRRAVR